MGNIYSLYSKKNSWLKPKIHYKVTLISVKIQKKLNNNKKKNDWWQIMEQHASRPNPFLPGFYRWLCKGEVNTWMGWWIRPDNYRSRNEGKFVCDRILMLT